MTDPTAAACHRLFELMDNEPSTPHWRNNTEALYDRMLAEAAERARDETYIPPAAPEVPMGGMWAPWLLPAFED